MAQDYSQVNFRIPTKLKEDIEKASIANNRSITAELVSRLEQSFSTPETTQSLLEEAVMLTLKAVKDDPSLLNNPKVSSTYTHSNTDDKDSVEFINKKAP